MDTVFSILLTFFLSFFAPIPENAPVGLELEFATSTAVVVQVVDGDTIRVVQNQQEITIRYIGIDTPEPYRDGAPACFSKEASKANRVLVAGKTVELVPDRELTDKYDRQLRYVYVDGVFVNEVLVEQGYAKTLSIKPNLRFVERFSTAEKMAKEQRVGLWSNCDQ